MWRMCEDWKAKNLTVSVFSLSSRTFVRTNNETISWYFLCIRIRIDTFSHSAVASVFVNRYRLQATHIGPH